MPDHLWTELPANSPKLIRDSGDVVEKSLFAPAYEEDLNGDEQGFACYLDEHQALIWWHRNVAKAGQYFLQGWRKHRVYPDFIFAKRNNHIVVIETKGDQLEGNLDTTYKQKLLNIASNNFAIEQVTKAGKLELVVDDKLSQGSTVTGCYFFPLLISIGNTDRRSTLIDHVTQPKAKKEFHRQLFNFTVLDQGATYPCCTVVSFSWGVASPSACDRERDPAS